MRYLILSAMLLVAFAAEARPPHRNQVREHRQEKRIRQGVRQGDLTKEEAKGLRQEQREIDKAQRDARSDGKVTIDEKKNLEQMQDAASKNIREERRD